MNRRSGLNANGSGYNPKRSIPTPYENIQIMIKYSKAIHAANAGKTRQIASFLKSTTNGGDNQQQPLQIYGLNQSEGSHNNSPK
jgi:hypothetical protein